MDFATTRTHPKLLDLLSELTDDQRDRLLKRRGNKCTIATKNDGAFVWSDGRPVSENQATRLQQIARQMLVDTGRR